MFRFNIMRRLSVVAIAVLSILGSMLTWPMTANAAAPSWPVPISPGNMVSKTFHGKTVVIQDRQNGIEVYVLNYKYPASLPQFLDIWRALAPGFKEENLAFKLPNVAVAKFFVPLPAHYEYQGYALLDLYRLNFTFGINPQQTDWIANQSMPVAHKGRAYHARIRVVDQGNPPLTCRPKRAMPAGLTLNRSTCIITGTPTKIGTFPIKVESTNHLGVVAETLPFLTLTVK